MLDKTKQQTENAIEHFMLELAKLQTGRANPNIVEDIRVDSYGAMTPIKNISTVWVLDPQTLSIKPWDRSMMHSIARAITDAWVWLNPQTMADSILIKLPTLTEDRRKELVKIVWKMSEEAKISIRNIRQEHIKYIKSQKTNDEITEDEQKEAEKNLQKLIDDTNKEIDTIGRKKEEDLMKI